MSWMRGWTENEITNQQLIKNGTHLVSNLLSAMRAWSFTGTQRNCQVVERLCCLQGKSWGPRPVCGGPPSQSPAGAGFHSEHTQVEGQTPGAWQGTGFPDGIVLSIPPLTSTPSSADLLRAARLSCHSHGSASTGEGR